MSRNHKKKVESSEKQQPIKWLILLFVAFVIIIILLLVIQEGSRNANGNRTDSRGNDLAETELDSAADVHITFPLLLENGKLEISSLFPYTGMNPDCGNEEGTDIGGLVLTNRSDEHLAYAKMTVQLMDDTVLEFAVKDVPAGQVIWVFDMNNGRYDESSVCKSIDCDVEFAPETNLMSDQLSVQTDGMNITLTNISDKELTNLEVICHCLLSDAYFGGASYTYPVSEIAPGENITITAEDCFMGDVGIVGIAPGD